MKHLRAKHTLKLAGLLILALLVSASVYLSGNRIEHCVSQIHPEGSLSLNLEEPRCFNTQAEAIAYATDGMINLPSNASPIEIDAALREFYQSQ